MSVTRFLLSVSCLVLAGCGQDERGPVHVVAIGPEPALVNPNREPVSPAAALLFDAVAQGLVRYDAAGEIEPALAQSWIVSDDGRRYTFRLSRALWANGERVTAKQVVERLQAALARNSRNPLKPVLGSIQEIEAMTEQVLEIRLVAPRPNFLQLLAQPELAILSGNQGTGPWRLGGIADGAMRIVPPPPEEDADQPEPAAPEIRLSGDPAPLAIARFAAGDADLVTGGTVGELPLLVAADLPAERAVFDQARGLFGLVFAHTDGALGNARFRHALSMAIDREAIAGRIRVPALQPRVSLLPPGLSDLPSPAVPDYGTVPLPARREAASRIVREVADGEPLRLRVAMPRDLGYRVIFAHLRRDWRAIGVEAVAVVPGAEADLRLIDRVAPADLAPWYLRHFLCSASAVCDAGADQLIEAARQTPNAAERQGLLAQADRALVAIAPFIPIGQPVRWSLRSERLNGFRANPFARHSLIELIEQED